MNITSRTRGLIAASLAIFGFAGSVSQAQTVTVNGSACSTATVTLGAGTININTAGCAGGPVAQPPSISSLSVVSGLPNAAVTINGANLAGASVTIGGVATAASINANGTQISTSVPVSATLGAGNLIVTVAGFSPVSAAFTVLAPPPPTAPVISSVSPASGSAGSVVTISGTGFSTATVTIGGAAANFSLSGNTITATVPAAATVGLGNVVVTVGSFTQATSAFTVLAPPPPTISAVSPASGAIGSVVTISGSGLTNATVTIGGATATLTLNSATSITATVPATAVVGAGSVVVTTAVTPAASTAFTVTAAQVGEFSNDVPPIAISNPSKQAFIIPPFHGGANGAGDEVRAFSMNPARCSTTPALTRSWQHNIDLNDYKGKNAFDFFTLQTNESLSFKFTVGSVDAAGGFIYNDGANARVRPTFISITETPCNFDASKLVPGPTRDSCYSTGINGQGVNWANITTELPASYCRLVKGRTYYMNLRFQDARPVSEGGSPTTDSCPTGNCGGIIQVL